MFYERSLLNLGYLKEFCSRLNHDYLLLRPLILIKNTEPAASNKLGDHGVAERNVIYFTICNIKHKPGLQKNTKTLRQPVVQPTFKLLSPK
jgi:hypothetical protein